jgi:hypothetical protein
MKRLRIHIPAPHARQAEIEACTAKRIVVKAGRRGGKTTMVARMAVGRANAGRRQLYATPIFSQTDVFWELCVRWLWHGIQVGLVEKNETKRTLKFIRSGGTITARTASRPDHLRGLYADDLYLDEYAYMDPMIWERVAQPMLIDHDGNCLFVSTGQKRNHFFLLGLVAQQNNDGRWAFFRFPSTENPFLSASAIADLAKDMTEEEYAEEILAEDVEGEGAVFRLYRDDFLPGLSIAEILTDHAGHRGVAGNDWGRRHDYSCMSIGCATCSREVMLRRWQAEDYPTQRDIIKGIWTQLVEGGFSLEILSEENAMGLPNLEQMRSDGVPVNSLMVRNAEKAQLVQGLRLTFEQRAWKWVWDLDGWRELEGYEAKITPGGHITYNAPEALHDDSIVARYLMLHQAKMGTFTLA